MGWNKVMRFFTQEENHVVRKYLLSGAPYIDISAREIARGYPRWVIHGTVIIHG